MKYIACIVCAEFVRNKTKASQGCWVCGWSSHLPVAMSVEVALIGAHPSDELPTPRWVDALRALRLRWGLPMYPERKEHQCES